MKKLIYLVIGLSLICLSPLAGVSRRASPSDQGGVKRAFDDLRYELMNQQMQLQVFQEKFETQEEIVESLASQLDQRKLKGNIEAKLTNLEKLMDGLAEDVRRLHANTVESKKRLDHLEKISNHRSSDLEHMQTALNALMTAMGETPISNSYTVKRGDTLGEIAYRNKTTIKALKELNQLKNDTIREGQKLKLP